jgi:hypothetical protein
MMLDFLGAEALRFAIRNFDHAWLLLGPAVHQFQSEV